MAEQMTISDSIVIAKKPWRYQPINQSTICRNVLKQCIPKFDFFPPLGGFGVQRLVETYLFFFQKVALLFAELTSQPLLLFWVIYQLRVNGWCYSTIAILPGWINDDYHL